MIVTLNWQAAAVIIALVGSMLGGAFWLGQLQANKISRVECAKNRSDCVSGVNGMFSKIWKRIDEMADSMSTIAERISWIEGRFNGKR